MLGKIKNLTLSDLIGLSVFSLVFSMKLNTYSIMEIVFYCSFFIKKNNFKEVLKSKNLFLFSCFYLLCIVAILWSCDFNNGLHTLERRISLLLFPLIFFSFNGKIDLDKIFTYLLFATAIAFLFSFFLAYYNYYLTGDKWTPFRYFNFTKNSIGMHPGYLSIYMIICLIYSLEKVVLETILKKRKWILITFFFFFAILYIGAKSSFFILNFIIIFYIIKYANNKKTTFFYLLSYILILAVTSYFFYFYSYGFRTRIFFLISGKYSNIQERIDIYQSIFTFLERNPLRSFIGHGTGCLRPKLLEIYHEFGLQNHYAKNLDAHNIFFKSFAEQGLLGLIATFSLFQGLNLKFLKINFKYFLFSMTFFIFGLIEHFLDTQHGIVFFTMFNVLFYKNYLDETY